MIAVLAGLSRAERRAAIIQMEKENRKYGDRLRPLEVPPTPPGWQQLLKAWRSSEFLVQAFDEGGHGIIRLTINRTHVHPQTFEWVDGITWDEIQSLKEQAGYGDHEALEVYPPVGNVVNVASLRHIWVLPLGQRMPFSWKQE